MKKVLIAVLVLLVGAVVFYTLTQHTPQKVNMLLVNGNIYTFDSKNSVVQAVAIRDDRIVGVGSTEELMKRFAADQVIDLQGKTVLPGLIDGHAHILGEGGRLQTLNLIGTKSADEIAGLVAERVKNASTDEWIIGRGWDQNDWNMKAFPDRAALDRVAPTHPVALRRVDGHAVWVNSKALELAGISAATPDTAGGKIVRDGKGNPTGIFVDNAVTLIDRRMPELTDAEIEQRLKLAMEECARLGLTEVHDMGVDLQVIAAYKRLIDRGECPIRIYGAIDGPGAAWQKYLTTGPEIDYGNGRLTIRTLKLYIDGALGSRGAALFDSYSDEPGNRGLTVMSEADIDTALTQAREHGFQVCTHAIGDRGNYLMLNAYEKNLRGDTAARWRIEHVQVLQPSDVGRFQKLGVLPAMQPTHATSDMPWAEERLGPERIKNAYAWRSILQTGVHIIGGSDFPVEYVNPLYGIYAAITRSDRDGYPPNGWFPEQRMTREEAVRAFSQWTAYGAFQEDRKGTIDVGKWADLTVLPKDIMTGEPKEIIPMEVAMTMVGGKVVYQHQTDTAGR